MSKDDSDDNTIIIDETNHCFTNGHEEGGSSQVPEEMPSSTSAVSCSEFYLPQLPTIQNPTFVTLVATKHIHSTGKVQSITGGVVYVQPLISASSTPTIFDENSGSGYFKSVSDSNPTTESLPALSDITHVHHLFSLSLSLSHIQFLWYYFFFWLRLTYALLMDKTFWGQEKESRTNTLLKTRATLPVFTIQGL